MNIRHALSAAALAFAALPLMAQQVVPLQSEISFVSRQMGVPVEGRFKRFDARMSFDPAKPEAAKITLAIDTGSAAFGSPETDAEVPKAAWFNVAKFPQAAFQSTSVKAAGPNRYDVSGKLTVKGVTRDITVPVVLVRSGQQATATGSFAIKRLDFNIGEGEWSDTSMVANDVNVKFKLVLTGLPG